MQKYLVDLSEEDHQQIKELAALFFTPREIAIMMQLDANGFVSYCDDPQTKIYASFHSGRLQSEVDLRTAVIKLAKSGSSPAQTMSLDMLKASKVKMIDK